MLDLNIITADSTSRTREPQPAPEVTKEYQEPSLSNPSKPSQSHEKPAKPAASSAGSAAKKSSLLFSKLPSITASTTVFEKDDYTPSNAPAASDSFASMNVSRFILDSLRCLQITNATAIQKRVIPHLLNQDDDSANSSENAIDILEQRRGDIIVQAQTGSGKTLAYLIPILQDLISTGSGDRLQSGTMCLIVLPTRELCQQVYDTVYSLLYPKSSTSTASESGANGKNKEASTEGGNIGKACKFRWIVPGVLSGGQAKKSEKARLRKGITILISTPGRLLDHLRSTQALNLRKLRWIVVDEADRFEEMGMKDSLNSIWQELERFKSPFRSYQKVICSATVRSDITELGGIKLTNPTFLSSSNNFKNGEEQLDDDFIPNQVQVTFVTVPAKIRLVLLVSLLRIIYAKKKDSKTIIFFSNCATVEFYHHLLTTCVDLISGEAAARDANGDSPAPASKISLHKLHGEIAHADRMKVIKSFKSSGILLTTDLAARGLDFPSITEIIQFDIPNDKLACVHRIGRTARCGSVGNAYIFVMPHEQAWIDYVGSEVSIHGNTVTFEKIITDLAKIVHSKEVRVEMAKWQRRLEDVAAKSMKMAKDAYMTSVRAYATHPKEVRKVLGVKKLHLGHFAKSFGLRDAPSKIISNRTAVKKRRIESKLNTSDPTESEQRVKRMKIGRDNIMQNFSSEFSAFN